MDFPMKPLPKNIELGRFIERAAVAYEAMSPEQKRQMHEAQRRSWAVGEMMLEHQGMSRDEAEAIYESIIRQVAT